MEVPTGCTYGRVFTLRQEGEVHSRMGYSECRSDGPLAHIFTEESCFHDISQV